MASAGAFVQVAQNEELTGFSVIYSNVHHTQASKASDGAWAAKQPYRQQEDSADQPQDPRYRNAKNPERQGQKPHEGINH